MQADLRSALHLGWKSQLFSFFSAGLPIHAFLRDDLVRAEKEIKRREAAVPEYPRWSLQTMLRALPLASRY